MLTAPFPENENERLAQLNQYNILNTASEKDYDDITQLAATICKTPISLITFVDSDKQWFKSHQGIAVTETEREYAFCAHALNKPEEILIVPDSRKDKRFEDNPLVTGDPHVIFYTGVPLVNPRGYALGTLCVIDNKPNQLSEEQLEALKTLSKQVINLLELRKSNIDLQNAKDTLQARNKELEHFATVISHDIKSPLTSILLACQLIEADYSKIIGEEGIHFLSIAKKASVKINSIVENVLSYYRETDATNCEQFDLTELIASIIPLLNSTKDLRINYPMNRPLIFMNKTQMEQVLFNLFSNSIKYNDKEFIKVDVSFYEDATSYHFSITDNGTGIAKEDQSKIFTLFTKLASPENNDNNSYGIGLAIVKKIIEKNNGYISVNSTPGEGTTFSFYTKKIKQ